MPVTRKINKKRRRVSHRRVSGSKKSTKKYRTRKSPAYSAAAYCGQRKKGNDGNMYISISNINNICRWKLTEK